MWWTGVLSRLKAFPDEMMDRENSGGEKKNCTHLKQKNVKKKAADTILQFSQVNMN